MRYWNAFLRVKERKPRSEIFASKKTGNGFFCSLDFVIMLSLFLLALDSAAIVEGFFHWLYFDLNYYAIHTVH